MNKKKLPRAIRPEDRRVSDAIAGDTPAHLATLHEANDDNLETTEDSIAAGEAISSDAAKPVTDTRRARATKLVERFSLWSSALC